MSDESKEGSDEPIKLFNVRSNGTKWGQIESWRNKWLTYRKRMEESVTFRRSFTCPFVHRFCDSFIHSSIVPFLHLFISYSIHSLISLAVVTVVHSFVQLLFQSINDETTDKHLNDLTNKWREYGGNGRMNKSVNWRRRELMIDRSK